MDSINENKKKLDPFIPRSCTALWKIKIDEDM